MGKQFVFAAALCSAVFLSCNQMDRADQEAREQHPEVDTVTPGQRLDSALNRVERGAETTRARIDREAEQAEAAVAKAKQDLSDAKDRGDKKAEREAQQALDKATAIWSRTKEVANRAADATRDAADRAVDATRGAARKTGDAVDTTYQRASRKVNDVLHQD